MKEFSVIILTAGHSKRMGSNKALLNFGNNRCFLEQLICQYVKAGISDIHIVSQGVIGSISSEFGRGVHVHWIKNRESDKGRAWSIYLSTRSSSDWMGGKMNVHQWVE